ncbi:MAG: preprotein translocase subunit SecA [Bacillati bacterium ANGP1]|uniref:Protein translocase subunit SecA n=1 Tax=Candidatus Segetimicrobium genomatis TaxID=2569760 RepID=A0A537JV96_9BACT|nr:MAG: preprotein translocase subunit SecA [Terrabacteria group bacterium ANGP1]
MLKLLQSFLGDPSERIVKQLGDALVPQVNALEGEFEGLPEAALRGKLDELRSRAQGGEALEALMPETFALVREASKRTLGQRHHDVQLIGGAVLFSGKIAEMKTGEGKTLVATLPLVLNALEGRGGHLVTPNDYLSRMGAGWMGPIYALLGLRVGVITHEFAGIYDPAYEDPTRRGDDRLNHFRPVPRREAYLADITYGTNNEFGFDYLRDNMVIRPEDLVQRELHYAIVDEVDFILIDEARTPLIISGQVEQSVEEYYRFAKLIGRLQAEQDYHVDEKLRTAVLTEEGITTMEGLLGIDNLTDPQHIELMHHAQQALRAHTLYHRDVEYVVKDGQVIIVDEFTGRLMFGRRYSDGLHQAIEAKEGVRIEKESQTLATITFQNYFRMYHRLAGMTGTAKTEEAELTQIYNLPVVGIPTDRPMIRQDLADLIYKHEKAKTQAVAAEIEDWYKQRRPVLVGTRSIEKSEALSALLRRRGVPHQVLNAKYHEKEAEIIAQAGRSGAVTIATNMAGRGVDIILGGNPAEPGDADKVKALGGLHIIGTERHEARRIDNQLRGRAGRQGDPGSSRFYVALDDELMRLFAGERIASIMERLGIEDDVPIEHAMVSRQIEGAQKKVESYHFDMRKHILEYDDVMNVQRKVIYAERRKILTGESVRENILDFIETLAGALVDGFCSTEVRPEEWDLAGLLEEARFIFPLPPDVSPEAFGGLDAGEVRERLLSAALAAYEAKVQSVGPETMREVERVVLLQTLDRKWIDHLYAMDALREGIGLRAYGQANPLIEYQKEGYALFEQLKHDVLEETVKFLYLVQVQQAGPVPLRPARPAYRVARQDGDGDRDRPRAHPAGAPAPVHAGKVGRNDPCPCGSGKKYKKCHGKDE